MQDLLSVNSSDQGVRTLSVLFFELFLLRTTRNFFFNSLLVFRGRIVVLGSRWYGERSQFSDVGILIYWTLFQLGVSPPY